MKPKHVTLKTNNGLVLQIPFENLKTLINENPDWVLGKKYNSELVERWMREIEHNEPSSELAASFRDFIDPYCTLSKYRNLILGKSIEEFQSSHWVQFVLRRRIMYDAGLDTDMLEGGANAELFKASLADSLNIPVSLDQIKELWPFMGSIIEEVLPENANKDAIRFEEFLPGNDMESAIQSATTFQDKFGSDSIQKDSYLFLSMVIAQGSYEGISKRYSMLLSGLSAVWSGFLVREDNYDRKKASEYTEYLVNQAKLAIRRFNNKKD